MIDQPVKAKKIDLLEFIYDREAVGLASECQLVSQLTLNQQVTGSTPVRLTREITVFLNFFS